MKQEKRTFKNGTVIFRENDGSDSMFVLRKGNVELTKAGEKGPVMLAMLKAGEMFGEMGILDEGNRSATATAVGDVVVDETSRIDFMEALQTEPGMALNVMGKLVERLRIANERLAHPTTVEKSPARKSSAAPSMLGMLKKLVTTTAVSGERLDIRVAPFAGELPEAAEAQHRHVVQSLGKRKGIRIKAQNKMPKIDPELSRDEQLIRMDELARKCLSATDSDMLIWGDIPPPGTTLHLRFFSADADDDDRPGYFLPFTVLTLPVDFGPELAELLLAVALAATASKDESKRVRLGHALAEALYAAMPAVQSLPHDLTGRERAAIQMCFGNAVATLAVQRSTVDLFQVAAQTYRAALESMTQEDSALEWAITNKHLGAVLQAIAERSRGSDALAAAVDAFGAALKFFTRTEMPVQWASIQNRLGLVLYKLFLIAGDTEMLKLSLAAFQASIQVFTRKEAPERWAEVMNNFAQAAQVLGEQLSNIEVLEKAVEACRGALEIRTREKSPLLWAATQNTLGSALFLLGKVTEEQQDLDGANEAFGRALDVYQKFNATRLAMVAEKNLSRVKELEKEISRPGGAKHQVPKLDWEKEEGAQSLAGNVKAGKPGARQ